MATEKCSRARFLYPRDPPYPITPLLSIPGSGNTWTRLLVQHLTGILTGSVYYDGEKVRSGLYGESLLWNKFPQNYPRTFVIKTHSWHDFNNSASEFVALFPLPALRKKQNFYQINSTKIAF